eukprot:342785-Pelagomonas_calceolata.AAC.3
MPYMLLKEPHIQLCPAEDCEFANKQITTGLGWIVEALVACQAMQHPEKYTNGGKMSELRASATSHY